jgi:hypothetical protein
MFSRKMMSIGVLTTQKGNFDMAMLSIDQQKMSRQVFRYGLQQDQQVTTVAGLITE